MLVFSVYLLILAFIRLVIPQKWNSILVIVAGTFLFIISALRSIDFASDTTGYVNKYLSLSYVDFSILLDDLFNGVGKDPFFYLFSKVISIAGFSYQVWLAVIASIFCFSISKLIYRYSNEPFISFVALISLGYFYFSLTGLRQTMALGCIILSYKYLKERNIIPFVLLVLLGSLFHSSALIFLISYPVANIKIGWKQLLGIGAAFIVSLFYSNQIREIIRVVGWTDSLVAYADQKTSLSISGFIIQLSIFLFCLKYKKELLKKDKNNQSLYNLLFLGLIFQAFSTVIAEFFRISMYFSIFSIILIPMSIGVIKDKQIMIIVYLSVFVMLVAYIYWTGSFSGYKFYWQ